LLINLHEARAVSADGMEAGRGIEVEFHGLQCEIERRLG
jgi:hypothetical protein